MTVVSRAATLVVAILTTALATVGTTTAWAGADPAALRGDETARIGSASTGPAPRLAARATSTAVRRVQKVTLKWSGGWKEPVQTTSATIPGIGEVTLVCRPNTTMIRLFATDRSAETQMWLAKHEVKDQRNVVATKTVRIYRYAHAFDDGTGGTGSFAHEGLNQVFPIENYSSGYVDGIISQRPGRHQPAAGAPMAPVTSFRLNWYWNGFHHPAEYRFCQFDAVFKTTFPTRLGVNWHGEADAVDNVLQSSRLPSIGQLNVRCGTNDDGGGGIQSISLVPDVDNASVYAETVTGEGDVDDHVDPFSKGFDPETGKVGPIPVPRNGMVRLFFSVGGIERRFIASSYYVTNNGNARLNLCELAVAPY
ncbi:hypothetical protein NPS01_23580 [Nocardioides psychrotolerans]|uniref:Uncharacterized protein n=1 Tax=Nocardioides psychrotolerans TaxID=1005945 RepID=A0A1I3HXI5_9ACTN|nr:hypothetical protein [Nocardioides psychrotolerans]GEP38695.1 hypothetical protein NPS01_23580 [Nocardioides psychrotolerans]SFI40300.1 hypothetical protein SAMN05216561_10824 [Nocardioides psychrotolerans]